MLNTRVALAAGGIAIAAAASLTSCPSPDPPPVEQVGEHAEFWEHAEQFLARVDQVADAAQGFDQGEALAAIGPSRSNGEFFRFDDHVADASRGPCGTTDTTAEHDLQQDFLLSFEFTGEDEPTLTPSIGQAEQVMVQDGVARFPGPGGFETITDVVLDPNAVGEVLIRARAPDGARLFLGWSKYSRSLKELHPTSPKSPGGQTRESMGFVPIRLTPSDEYLDYKILASSSFGNRQRLAEGEVVRRLFVWRADKRPAEVEIDSVRITHRASSYRRRVVGQSYERLDGEMRPGLFMTGPCTITYDVKVPDELPRLSFGLGAPYAQGSLGFSVSVQHGEQQELVYSGGTSQGKGWVDESIELSRWAGENVRMTFALEGEDNAVGFWSNPVMHGAPEKRLNVIVVLEDALRADHMSAYGYSKRQTTPEKERFASEGVLFRTAISQGGETRPSIPSIMTSLYPTATAVIRMEEYLGDNFLTLAEVLRHSGFVTVSRIQNANAGATVGLHQGFSFLSSSSHGALDDATEAMYDDGLVSFLRDHRDRNVFAYLHIADPHGPYDPPEPFDSWYRDDVGPGTEAAPDNRIDASWVDQPTEEGRELLYDGEIRHNDELFGRLLSRLDDEGLLEDTLIVHLSDHGEHLGEHGEWEHGAPGFIQTLHVPLMMRYPKALPQGRVVTEPVQLADVMPTILDLAGIPRDSLLMHGDSLLPLIEDKDTPYWQNRLVLSEERHWKSSGGSNNETASIFYRNWHLLSTRDIKRPKGAPALVLAFDYLKDPEETDDLPWARSPEFQERLRSFIGAYQERTHAVWVALASDNSQPVVLDEEAEGNLRALGYIE